jgi:biopolymer transport protein ExbB
MIYGIILQVTQATTQAVADTMAATQAINPPPVEQSISLWELLQKGGPILIPIGILSVLAVYIFFERYFTILRYSKMDMNFMNMIRDHVHNGNIDAAKSLCKHTKGPVARMIEKGLMRLGKPIHEIEAAIENVGKLEVYTMEKNLGIMSTIAGLAPMFGFLGTIFGVIKIFYEINLQNSLEIGTISGGLYVKMIASAAGLLVGIIAYAGYQFLIHRIDRVVHRMEMNSVEFMDLLEEPVK